MPELTLAELEDIRAEAFADDISLPPDATSWTRERAVLYFETAGQSEQSGYEPHAEMAWTQQQQSSQQQQQQPPEIRAVAVSHASKPVESSCLPMPVVEIGTALSASLSYEVVHSFVRVRKTPEVLGVELGLLKKGAIVSVDAIHNDWVRLEEEPVLATGSEKGSGGSTSLAGGWMLTDGKSLSNFTAVKLGTLLEPRITPAAEGTIWQVTKPGGCLGYETPGGSARGELGQRRSELGHGRNVHITAECGLWARARVAESGTELWVPMDAFFAG